MGYYTRVFCKAERFPTLIETQAYMHSLSTIYRLEGEVAGSYWTNLNIYYKEGKHPIPVDLNWCDEDGSVGKEELAEFIDEIASPGLSIKKWKAIKHLKKTKFIICNQLLSDLDEDG
jgi:hypothetical protein